MAEPVELRTERLLLRRFRAGDVDDALAYRNDAELVRYLPHIPHPFTRADAEAFVARNIDEPWDVYPTFGIVRDHRVIGTVNFEVNATDQIAILGFAIARAHWGQGITVEAARAAVTWAFDAFGLAKICASTDGGNLRSQRVLEKLGMRLEGRLRAHQRARDGSRADAVCYGLLHDEWPTGATGAR